MKLYANYVDGYLHLDAREAEPHPDVRLMKVKIGRQEALKLAAKLIAAGVSNHKWPT